MGTTLWTERLHTATINSASITIFNCPRKRQLETVTHFFIIFWNGNEDGDWQQSKMFGDFQWNLLMVTLQDVQYWTGQPMGYSMPSVTVETTVWAARTRFPVTLATKTTQETQWERVSATTPGQGHHSHVRVSIYLTSMYTRERFTIKKYSHNQT